MYTVLKVYHKKVSLFIPFIHYLKKNTRDCLENVFIYFWVFVFNHIQTNTSTDDPRYS